MWVFSHFIPTKQYNFVSACARDLIIILGNKLVLIYATGKTLVTAIIILSHLTLVDLAHLC